MGRYQDGGRKSDRIDGIWQEEGEASSRFNSSAFFNPANAVNPV
jgi:hypothetical protein